MRAVQFTGINELVLANVPEPTPGPGEVLVRLRASALNHRDLWIKQGQYAGLAYPCIPGSDGAGVIEEAGEGVARDRIGGSVIINPSFGWGESSEAQGPEFTILGLPRAGTLAEKIVVPVQQTAPKPVHLSWEEAAALPLAALTAYRALFTRAELQPGERVLITGIGGGVALMALQLAIAHGAIVSVTSSSADKLARAATLGAQVGYDYNQADWAATAAQGGPYDVIIDSAGGSGFENLIDLAAAGGRIVFFGATRGNPSVLPMRKVFWRQLSLLGTTMGNPADWNDLLDFVNRHELKPVVSGMFPLDSALEAFAQMEEGAQFGKLVLIP